MQLGWAFSRVHEWDKSGSSARRKGGSTLNQAANLLPTVVRRKWGVLDDRCQIKSSIARIISHWQQARLMWWCDWGKRRPPLLLKRISRAPVVLHTTPKYRHLFVISFYSSNREISQLRRLYKSHLRHDGALPTYFWGHTYHYPIVFRGYWLHYSAAHRSWHKAWTCNGFLAISSARAA